MSGALIWGCGRAGGNDLLFPFCSPLLTPVLSQETPGQSLQTTAPKKGAVRCGVRPTACISWIGTWGTTWSPSDSRCTSTSRRRSTAQASTQSINHQSSKWRRASAKLICARGRNGGATRPSRGVSTRLHEQHQQRPIRHSTQQPEQKVSVSPFSSSVWMQPLSSQTQTQTAAGVKRMVKKALQRRPRQGPARLNPPPSSFFFSLASSPPFSLVKLVEA